MVNKVGAEYVIANYLIALEKTNRSYATCRELIQLDAYLKERSIAEDIDVIFLMSHDKIMNAVQEFPDYFEYSERSKCIYMCRNRQLEDLKRRFIGYLPIKVIFFVVNKCNAFLENHIYNI